MEGGHTSWWEPPGGPGFSDVTSLFAGAANEMESNNLIFMDQFTLHDAMSVLEIGEPRLDSGLITPERSRPPFEPTSPLLPEEVCWILDRAAAFETEFLSGNFLAHTVYTLLYVHHLRDLDFELAMGQPRQRDPARPIELVTIVLRSAVQGLLKCCDLVWRELAKGGAYDSEDWQSDKSEISLLENIPVSLISSQIDAAFSWLQKSNVSEPWKTALQSRLVFRKALLDVLSTPPRESVKLHGLIASARSSIFLIQSHPSPPSPPSPLAEQAFDPHISRRLQMSTPIRVIPAPSFEETLNAYESFLDGLYEVGQLAVVNRMPTWIAVGEVQNWTPNFLPRSPFVRSLTQTTLQDGALILSKHSMGWLINQLFLDTLGVDYYSIRAMVTQLWAAEDMPPWKQVERQLQKLLIPHIKALWTNGPRRRRYFMRSLLDWHELYGTLEDIILGLDLDSVPIDSPIRILSSIALIPRLTVLREMVLSGFQLELYAPQERCFAYFYASEIIGSHIIELESVIVLSNHESAVFQEAIYQIQFLTALRAMCVALFLVCIPLACFDWYRIRNSFFRRYKWAFRKEYEETLREPVGNPDIYQFSIACDEPLKDGRRLPSESIKAAEEILAALVESQYYGPWISIWQPQRQEFLQNLLNACHNLRGLPSSVEELDSFDPKRLKWDAAVNPWFPSLFPSSVSESTTGLSSQAPEPSEGILAQFAELQVSPPEPT